MFQRGQTIRETPTLYVFSTLLQSKSNRHTRAEDLHINFGGPEELGDSARVNSRYTLVRPFTTSCIQ